MTRGEKKKRRNDRVSKMASKHKQTSVSAFDENDAEDRPFRDDIEGMNQEIEEDSVILDDIHVAMVENSDQQIHSIVSSPSTSNGIQATGRKRRHSSSKKTELRSNNSKSVRLPTMAENLCGQSNRAHFEQSIKFWNVHHLNVLGVHPKLKREEMKDPVNFIQEMMGSFLGYRGMNEYNELKAKLIPLMEITNCLTQLLHCVDLDFNSFKCVTIESINKMKADLKLWRKMMIKNMSDELTDFCLRAESHGQSFAEQLEYMVTVCNRGRPLHKGMYQQLFMLYLQMFGLKVYGFSNIGEERFDIKDKTAEQTLKIGPVSIKSVPDLVIMDTKNLASVEVTAVIEVREDVENVVHLNGAQNSSGGRGNEAHIDEAQISSELIGQHGGQLIVHSPLSIFEDKGIFGMIVQATKVSLSFFAPEDGYILNLESGYVMPKQAEIILSEHCNILSKTGRQALLTPLLELLFLQKVCKLKGKEAFYVTHL